LKPMKHARLAAISVSAAIHQIRLVIATLPASRQIAWMAPVGPLDVNKGGMVSGDKKENL
jgi:hypothetical protein